MAASAPAALPWIRVVTDGKPAAVAAESPMLFSGVLVYGEFAASPGAYGGSRPQATFEFVAASGSSPRYRVSIAVPEAVSPHLVRGTDYAGTYYYKDGDLFAAPRSGLVLRGAGGAAAYVLSSNGGVPADALPSGVAITASDRLAFRTTTVSQSGCMLRKTHRFVEVKAGERTVSLAPGESRVFVTGSGAWLVWVFDNSEASTSGDEECLAEDPAHFSYAVLPAAGRD